jgi:3-phosphoshikimate 1-carboxyvinyltransferase
MKRYRITAPESREIHGEINLPSSKSATNRTLIMNALSGFKSTIHSNSEGSDARILRALLSDNSSVLQAGIGGTTYRFMLAWLATQEGRSVRLEAEGKMNERPIGELVDGLNQLGADIRYTGKIGFPPVQINGKKLVGGRAKMRGDISSQFLSALALVAPYCENEVELLISENQVSKRYFEWTLSMMEQAGISLEHDITRVVIQPDTYSLPEHVYVEPDWSAASYWYGLLTLAKESVVKIPNLKNTTLQPDTSVCRIYNGFGVSTIYGDEVSQLVVDGSQRTSFGHRRFDLIENPDLAQTIAVTTIARGESATLDGLQTLKLKETDRIEALATELKKIGADVEEINEHKLILSAENPLPRSVEIVTYGDHRMAMAFAPLALVMDEVFIQDPDVVNKSYPTFWDDLRSVGFGVTES